MGKMLDALTAPKGQMRTTVSLYTAQRASYCKHMHKTYLCKLTFSHFVLLVYIKNGHESCDCNAEKGSCLAGKLIFLMKDYEGTSKLI